MRHGLILPNAVPVPAAAAPALHTDALHLWVRASLGTGRSIDNGQAALLGRNAVPPGVVLEEELLDGAHEGGVVHVPEARVDVARVHALDGDVPVLRVLEQAALQLGLPYLHEELVVAVVEDARRPAHANVAVAVFQVEDAQVVEAACRADDARGVRFGNGGEQAQCQEHVGEEVDLRPAVRNTVAMWAADVT